MKSIKFKADENKGPVVVLIGRRDTGKSFLVRDLTYIIIKIFRLELLYQEQKLVMDFIVQNMFLNYLYMMNIIVVIIENILKRQRTVSKTD